ncbi:MAG: tagatose 1,6-diphosphate aldolase [Bryobacterales bacterium]|nr:tagatose 1,6-diphosphate aldolase [Bryobacterales bacterium]
MNSAAVSSDKRRRLEAISTDTGVIAALAMDQRKSLRKMIAEAQAGVFEQVTDERLAEFKTAVTEELSSEASAILLDPEYGLAAASKRDARCGLLLTYEADGFENPRPHRMLALMPEYSVLRLAERGADAIKILLSYNPDGDPAANDEKCALIERIGHECEGAGVPFLLEPVVYDPAGVDPRSVEFAKRKPGLVVRTMREFSKPRYRVDVLKVEFPVNVSMVEGSTVNRGTLAYAREEALDWYRQADAAAGCPYIYLSAGVSVDEFAESLRLAAEAGAKYSGVLCGRANWQGGVTAYVSGGLAALKEWLASEGVKNMQRVNECLRQATPWMERM